MLSGKAGLVHIHMGTSETGLQPLLDALGVSDVPITQFLPTHMERHVAEAGSWIHKGGHLDFTAGAQASNVLL
jgi:beta-aspartyl-dipeptidase (metallo-type)